MFTPTNLITIDKLLQLYHQRLQRGRKTVVILPSQWSDQIASAAIVINIRN